MRRAWRNLLECWRPRPELSDVTPEGHFLLLDVDGVLIDLPDFYCSRFPSAPVRDFFANGFQSASTGKSSVLEHLPAFMAAVGREGSPEEFYREWLEYENRPNQIMSRAARELKRRGWRIFLATNQEELRTRHLLEQSGFGAFTEGHFASYAVGYRKPSEEYYAAVTRAFKTEPSRIIFWDDSPGNVEAARKAGWQAFLFTSAADFCRVMQV